MTPRCRIFQEPTARTCMPARNPFSSWGCSPRRHTENTENTGHPGLPAPRSASSTYGLPLLAVPG